MVFARRPGARGRCINHDRVGLTGASHTPAKRHVGEDEDVGRWARRPAHPRTDTDARTHTRAGSSMTSGPGCACERVRGLHILICAATAVDTSSRSANLAKLQRARSCETTPRLPLARCSLDPFFPPRAKNVHSGIPNYSGSSIRVPSPCNVGQGVGSCWERKVHVFRLPEPVHWHACPRSNIA